ncbi:unnamed protein product [Mytilus edulis]|uniref:C2H2-type domain-containing protein n=1 Tax=Mytilus edulis TaxID=6550 RepID=A0A8S3RY58_MYTED|nr:unnamed protein product [Mytilus edulis]
MHFVEFISSPMYHQAVGYGSKTLQLSSGLEMTIPKVVRNIITSRLITCYTAYCKDQGYETFSISTLYNILNCCVASLKKNLHGLDNITADGMKAVENITDVISRLQTFGLEEEKADKLRQMIYSANQHLKFEMKGHLSSESTCIDHCTVHSLSDASSVNFRANCNHEHTDGCNNCCLVNNFFHQIETTFKSLVSLPTDVIDEFDHDINRAKDQILSWKAHCYRTVHQDRAKTEVLRNLQDNQALVVMDWAMKLLPIKHREAQSDFFELILKSDNAGCYHCIPLISYIHNLNLHGNMDIKISQYNFSEAQSGKDICDAKTAHCKMHILRYTGEGHDVLTPEDMITALNSNGGVKGVFASVIAVDQKYEIKTKAKIPNISSMNNFEFQAYGVVVRRAYQIGKGQCYQLDKTIPVPLKGFKMVVPFPEFVEEHHGKVAALKESVDMNENNNQNSNVTENMLEIDELENENCDGLFACPEQSCVKEYTHPRFLESHICRGNHVYSKNENSYDKVKKIWSEKCIAVDRQYKVLVKSVSSEVSETKEGWALKTSRPCKRFTKKVKDYLYNIYLNCGTTGKRPNFDRLSIELKMQRIENGTKMFSREEWLSPSQIRSLFANYVKLGSPVLIKPEIIEDDEEIYNVLQEIETLEYHNGISELVTTIGSQFE